MLIAAHFQKSEAKGTARAPRRLLSLVAEGALVSGDTAAVTIHNVSATGLLIETATELAEDEAIEIALPEAGLRTARVVWNNDGFFGCRFEAPLSPATLSAIELRSAVQTESKAKAEPGDALPVLLLRLRKAKGLTLAAIAEGLGVSKPTVWAWEQGRSKPTADRIAPLAAMLGIEPERLAGEGDRSRLHAALAAARAQVAEAFGVTSDRVRIMIDL